MITSEFYQKLPLYRTAFSPAFNAYVGISRVTTNSAGEPLLDCYYQDHLGYFQNHYFHPEELTNYCL
jgi:hypothetical protein